MKGEGESMEEHIITSGPAAPGSASPKSVAPKFGGRVQLKTFHPKLDGRDLEDIPRIPMAMPGYDNGKTAPRIGAVFCFANSQY